MRSSLRSQRRESEAIRHDVPTSILPVSEIVETLLPETHALLFSVFAEQLLTLIDTGAMKSLSSAVKVSADRLFKYAFPKLTHSPAAKMPDVCRSIDASPKVNASRFRATACPVARIGSLTTTLLMSASAPATAPRLPQHGT